MASVAETDVSRAQKDISSSNFLSKLGRSPSRKNKQQASLLTSGLDPPFHPQNNRNLSGPVPKRSQPRPGFQRAPTAPAASVTLKSLKSELSAEDGAGAGRGDDEMLMTIPVVGTHSSKSADATPTAPEHPLIPDPQAGTTFSPTQSAPLNPQNPTSTYQHIQDLSNKRIATLDYMRKAHEGRIHWFNTLHFSKVDISRLPSYTSSRLSRRATNYFVLGLSIPAILDVHPVPHAQAPSATITAVVQDYLRTLNNLLTEFEAFQQLHPPDGSTSSSLSRARIPHMFKRVPTVGKPRRTSGAAGADIGLPMQPSAPSPSGESSQHQAMAASIDTTNSGTTFSSTASTLVTPLSASSMPAINFPPAVTFPTGSPFDSHANSTLLPNEGPYTYLTTPPLPFAPDFYCVFATLCDVLIDAYQRLLQLVNSPPVCTVSVGELFNKADARIRKVIVGGIVREFEGATREGAKRELAGVQRLVLGGLMGG